MDPLEKLRAASKKGQESKAYKLREDFDRLLRKMLLHAHETGETVYSCNAKEISPELNRYLQHIGLNIRITPSGMTDEWCYISWT